MLHLEMWPITIIRTNPSQNWTSDSAADITNTLTRLLTTRKLTLGLSEMDDLHLLRQTVLDLDLLRGRSGDDLLGRPVPVQDDGLLRSRCRLGNDARGRRAVPVGKVDEVRGIVGLKMPLEVILAPVSLVAKRARERSNT